MAKLDPKAVQEADAAFYKEHPEMAGTKIHPTDPDHQGYRDEWWTQYKDAQKCDNNKSGKKPNETSPHCPYAKNIQIKIVSLTFKSDHDLLLNNNTDWKDTGDRYLKPEWSLARGGSTDSHPISHTKGLKAKVDIGLEIEVTPEGQSADLSEIKGESTDVLSLKIKDNVITYNNFLTFHQKPCCSIKTESLPLHGLKADKPLPDCVTSLENCSIKWSAIVDGEEMEIGETGAHRIYLTYGIPYASAVTEKRIAHVVKQAENDVEEKDCVNDIFDKMMQFTYRLGAKYPSPVWLIYDRKTRGECNALADLFEKSCKMLGLPNKFKLGYIYPLIEGRGGKFSISGSANEKRNVSLTHSGMSLVHGPLDEILVFRDGSTRISPYDGWNCFEGTVEYDGSYYCIGEDRYNSPTDAMKRMVVATVWGWTTPDGTTGFCKIPGPYPEKVWNNDRWSNMPKP